MSKILLIALICLALWIWWRYPQKKKDDGLQDARALLGLKANAGREDIVAAHRRLITKVHPDAGGSAELTRQVNVARDRLLATLPVDKQG